VPSLNPDMKQHPFSPALGMGELTRLATRRQVQVRLVLVGSGDIVEKGTCNMQKWLRTNHFNTAQKRVEAKSGRARLHTSQ
jgi:cytolysin (calcineurin-like family phosphatase)